MTHRLVSPAYGWLLLGGVIVSLWLWSRWARRDERLLWIYFAALTGAFLGAKGLYLLSEGWLHWGSENRWIHWATGKSILGALPGGYAAVELAKKRVGYTQATGDRFAVVVCLGMLLGRTGCAIHGCCAGVPWDVAGWAVRDSSGVLRWPAAQAEWVFNAVALAAILVMRSRGALPGQAFHLYLVAYALFRFAHEFMRDTPKVFGGLSGYQFAAIAVGALGSVGFFLRQRAGRRLEPGLNKHGAREAHRAHEEGGR
jgi:phosphatidylglycerol:prolipoprotein diacylglycerol transferase